MTRTATSSFSPPARKKKILNTMDMGGSVYTTPVAANGVLYISTREKLYAIQQGASCDVKKVN